MPQLDISTFTPQLFWLAVWFVVLYLLMAHVALPRIAVALEARRQRREDDLARAAQLRAEAEAANAAFLHTMSQARAEAQTVIKAASDCMAAEAAERQRQLAARLGQQVADAEQRIALTKEEALAEMRGIAIDVGRAVVEKLTGNAPDAATLATAVDHSLRRQGAAQAAAHAAGPAS